MKVTHSSAYVVAEEVAMEILQRVTAFPRPQRPVLGQRLQHEAIEVLNEVTLALMFKPGRQAHLLAADKALLRLRLALRLAAAQKLIGTGQLRTLMERLERLGRMLGGWQRHAESERDTGPPRSDS